MVMVIMVMDVIWFWGINIPKSYGSGTTRARGTPHGDGRRMRSSELAQKTKMCGGESAFHPYRRAQNEFEINSEWTSTGTM